MALDLAVGMWAAFVGTLVKMPFDVAKSRLQNQRTAADDAAPKYVHTLQCCGVIWRDEGAAALFKGFSPTVMRIVLGQVRSSQLRSSQGRESQGRESQARQRVPGIACPPPAKGEQQWLSRAPVISYLTSSYLGQGVAYAAFESAVALMTNRARGARAVERS